MNWPWARVDNRWFVEWVTADDRKGSFRRQVFQILPERISYFVFPWIKINKNRKLIFFEKKYSFFNAFSFSLPFHFFISMDRSNFWICDDCRIYRNNVFCLYIGELWCECMEFIFRFILTTIIATIETGEEVLASSRRKNHKYFDEYFILCFLVALASANRWNGIHWIYYWTAIEINGLCRTPENPLWSLIKYSKIWLTNSIHKSQI